MVRLEGFLGSLKTSPPPSLIRCNWRCTRRVPASRSISDHFKPKASPILRPHVSDRTYKHSNLSHLAAGRSINDQGGSLVPDPDTEVPDLESKLKGLQMPRGWGLFLIRNMVDEMHITSDEVHHTVGLVMHLEGGEDAG